ncbi:MAG: hypothetical protein ACE5LB_10610 [Acidiferrobacterales bacterium]
MSEDDSQDGMGLAEAVIMIATAARHVVDAATIKEDLAEVPKAKMAVLELTLRQLEEKLGLEPESDPQ